MRSLFLVPLLAIAAVCPAIFPNNPESGFGAVGRLLINSGGTWITSGSAIAITPDTIITAWHTSGSTHFEAEPGQVIPITVKYPHPTADVALCRLATRVNKTAPIYFGPLSTLIGKECKLVGFGMTGNQRTLGWEILDGTQGVRRSANNIIDMAEFVTLVFGTGQVKSATYLVFDIDNPNGQSNGALGGPAIPNEGGIAGWDSGGGMFVYVDRMWRLVGIHGFIDVLPGSGVPTPYHYGGLGYSAYITPMKSWIQLIGMGRKAP